MYRSGHPHKTNFPFLDSLHLKSIMCAYTLPLLLAFPDPLLRRPDRYLATDDYRTDTHTWAQERGLQIFHFRIEVSKDPAVEVDEDKVREALGKVLGASASLTVVECARFGVLYRRSADSLGIPQTRATCRVSLRSLRLMLASLSRPLRDARDDATGSKSKANADRICPLQS